MNIYFFGGLICYEFEALFLEMKFTRTIALVLIVMTSATLPACRAPKDLIFKEVKDVNLENLKFSEAILTLALEFYNPNNFGMELRRTELDIYINNIYFGKSIQDIQVKVPKRHDFTLPIQVQVDIKNLLLNGLNVLVNKEVDIRVLGQVKIGKAGVFKSFKVDYSTKQPFSLLGINDMGEIEKIASL